MNDSCIITRETSSIREKDLKARLFGTAANGFKPVTPNPKTYVDVMKDKERKRHIAEAQPSEYIYKPPAQSASLQAL